MRWSWFCNRVDLHLLMSRFPNLKNDLFDSYVDSFIIFCCFFGLEAFLPLFCVFTRDSKKPAACFGDIFVILDIVVVWKAIAVAEDVDKAFGSDTEDDDKQGLDNWD